MTLTCCISSNFLLIPSLSKCFVPPGACGSTTFTVGGREKERGREERGREGGREGGRMSTLVLDSYVPSPSEIYNYLHSLGSRPYRKDQVVTGGEGSLCLALVRSGGVEVAESGACEEGGACCREEHAAVPRQETVRKGSELEVDRRRHSGLHPAS